MCPLSDGTAEILCLPIGVGIPVLSGRLAVFAPHWRYLLVDRLPSGAPLTRSHRDLGEGEPFRFRRTPNSSDALPVLSPRVAFITVSSLGHSQIYSIVRSVRTPYSWVGGDEPCSLISGACQNCRNGYPPADVSRTWYRHIWRWWCCRTSRDVHPKTSNPRCRGRVMTRSDARKFPSAVCGKSAACRKVPNEAGEFAPTGGPVMTAAWRNTPMFWYRTGLTLY